MTSYYYIKVCKNNNNFNNQLEYSLNNTSIGICFEHKEEINNIDVLNVSKHCKRMYNVFINEMKIGDIVFLCKGSTNILYMATISGEYYYDSNNLLLPHRRHITNIKEFKTPAPKRMIQTIYKV
jgi:hypothetical protein